MTQLLSMRRLVAAALALTLSLAAVPATQAQVFTNPNDANLNAYFVLHLGRNGPDHIGPNFVGYPSRWPLSGSTISLQLPLIDLCMDGMGAAECSAMSTLQSERIPENLLLAAMRSSAFQWNREIRDNAIAGQEFFTGCNASNCDSMPTYTPLTPTEALIMANGDKAGNATSDNSTTQAGAMNPENFNPGNRTCVFPAWSVDGAGDFDSWMKITSVSADGWGNFTDVATAAEATKLCTHHVQHSEPGGNRFLMTRDAQGRIFLGLTGGLVTTPDKTIANGGGDGRNRVHFEQVDFLTAGGGGVDTDATLAVTITRGLIGAGPVGSITEADILFNADLVLTDTAPSEDGVVAWTTNGATAASNCAALQGAINPEQAVNPLVISPDEDDSMTQLCYKGDGTYDPGGGTVAIFDVANVMTHEMGHFIGLDHPCREFELTDPDEHDCRAASDPGGAGAQTRYSVTTMFWSAHEGQTNARTVEQPDIDGLTELFGLDVDALFPVSSGGGICTINPRSNGWGWATWLIILMPAVLLLRRKRASAPVSRNARRNLLGALLALGVLAGASAAQATTVVTLSTAKMASRAQHVAHVKVTDVQVVRRPDGWISTVYTLAPVESIKGEGSFEVSVPGGAIGGYAVNIAGTPTMEVGREYIVFAKQAQNGRTIVSGVFQGVKPIAKDADTGTTWVRTGAGVPGTLHTTDEHGAQSKDAAVSAQELPELMELDDYKAYLRGLVGK